MRAEPAFAHFEKIAAPLVRTPIADHRRVFGELGMKLTADTYITAIPRRGPMTVK